MIKISVVLATYNEEQNIGACLESVRGLADEIVVVDGGSRDKTREITKKYGARVFKTTNPANFHINKNKAIDEARGDWILQLDADERLTPELAEEIRQVIQLSDDKIRKRKIVSAKERLFARHQRVIEERDGKFWHGGQIVAFFVPRRNYFLGKAMTYAGTYPDGVIRLVKRGKARFPAKSVHEQIQIDGEVAWLENDLVHLANPTLGKYFEGARRYTNLLAEELKAEGVRVNPASAIHYLLVKPVAIFLSLLLRHKGFLDGMHGFLWSLFSALYYPAAYVKCWRRQ